WLRSIGYDDHLAVDASTADTVYPLHLMTNAKNAPEAHYATHLRFQLKTAGPRQSEIPSAAVIKQSPKGPPCCTLIIARWQVISAIDGASEETLRHTIVTQIQPIEPSLEFTCTRQAHRR
ncbi:MAG: hypothetical protein J2P54_10065, partial [Bradyrhizobiaceae bacterium]|nr:hypothetical protein [Bradyrhizobiaceae bacterium]